MSEDQHVNLKLATQKEKNATPPAMEEENIHVQTKENQDAPSQLNSDQPVYSDFLNHNEHNIKKQMRETSGKLREPQQPLLMEGKAENIKMISSDHDDKKLRYCSVCQKVPAEFYGYHINRPDYYQHKICTKCLAKVQNLPRDKCAICAGSIDGYKKINSITKV